jgi:hypothetical protein
MAKTILVPVNSKKRIAVPLRHLETVVSAGDRIVFLAGCQRGILDRLSAHISLMQTGLETPVLCEERRTRLLWNEERTHLEQHFVLPARRLFGALAVEIDVNLYSGSLNRLIKRYQKSGEVVLISPRGPLGSGVNINQGGANNWFGWLGHYPFTRFMFSGDGANES